MKLGTLAVIGVGLIGGSLAAKLKEQGCVDKVIGFGRSRATLDVAQKLGLIDEAALDYTAIATADVIVLCVPVAFTEGVLRGIAPYLKLSAIVTDAGSTKQDVVAAARAALGGKIAQFVPAHPIAGNAVHGPSAADKNLYVNKRVVITPLAENSAADIETVSAIWQACGANIAKLSPKAHDEIFAAVSHLPHLLAYALVNQIAAAPNAAEKLSFAGGGFRDFTRIAASSPEMWRDIFAANQTALLAELTRYQTELATVKSLLEKNDPNAVEAWIASAAKVRIDWQSQ